jgi:trimeric autotransporter adhesin
VRKSPLDLFLFSSVFFYAAVVLAQQSTITAEAEKPRAVTHDPGGIGREIGVPHLIKITGVLRTPDGTPLTGVQGITLALYENQQDGAPVWMESQNIELDETGRYTVLLGATKTDGLPLELFTGGSTRWLGVQVQLPGYREEGRVLLVSVPYALKAADAETLGGKPLSAFVQTGQLTGAALSSAASQASTGQAASGQGMPAVGPRKAAVTGGTPGTLALFDTDGVSLVNSAALQSGGNIGIGTSAPLALFHVNNGDINLSRTGAWPVTFDQSLGSTFTITNGGAQRFALDASGNVGIGVTTPADLLHVSNGHIRLSRTGTWPVVFDQSLGSTFTITNGGASRLAISGSGNVGIGTVTPGYALDVAGSINSSGTVSATSFAGSGAALTGVPQLSAPNAFTASPTGSGVGQGPVYVNPASASAGQTLLGLAVNSSQVFKVDTSGNVTTSGTLNLPNTTSASIGVLNLGAYPFLHAYGDTTNAFIGNAAGNFTMTGNLNTALGSGTLISNTTGRANAALGSNNLGSNTTGNFNTAIGVAALLVNSTGANNTALGWAAGSTANALSNGNTTGSNNTFVGANTGSGGATPANLQNATAIGANAMVSANNSLVLGSINNLNGATSSVNVGIGTATPAKSLDVVGDIQASGCLLASGATIGGTCSSDERLKTEIRALPDALDKLAQLQPVSFQWRNELPEYRFGPAQAMGLIAQQVEQIFPEMVTTDERGFKQVNYSQLPYLMLQAIRELKTSKDRKEQEVGELKKQLEELRAVVGQLVERVAAK